MAQQVTKHHADSTRDPDEVRIEGMRWPVTTPDSPSSEVASPEDLYAAALASCLHQAVMLEATKAGVPTGDSTVRATASLTHDGSQRFGLQAQVAIELPSADSATAEGIRQRAVATCPLIGNVDINTDA